MTYAAAPSDVADREYRQRELFGLLMQFTGNRRPINELQSLASELRTRLDELNTAQADQFAIENVAFPLAEYYRSEQRARDVVDVLRIYGAAVVRMSEPAMSMLAAAWLTKLHDLYKKFDMHDDADVLLPKIETRSAGIKDELVRIKHKTTIPQPEFDNVVNDLTSGSKADVLRKIAFNFLPKVDEAEKSVKAIASQSFLMNVFTTQIVTEDGRVAASIGSVDDDLEGHVVQNIGQTMQFYAQIYRPVIEAAMSRQNLIANDFVDWLAECPLFESDRLNMLRSAFDAYLKNDWCTAIHLAIPQIEHALRQVLVHCNETLFRPHRNGTFLLKNLDEVLRDPVTIRAIPKDIRVYLRTLLCDQRGLNVRNNVCHGLWDSSSFNWFVADRVFHAILVLGLLGGSDDESDAIQERVEK